MHEPSNVAAEAGGAAPIGVRYVTAHVDTGRAAYGEPATASRRLPVGAVAVTSVAVTPMGAPVETPTNAPEDVPAGEPNGTSPDPCPLLWRLDVDAVLPQPEGRAAAFQEQETFAATAGLEAVIEVPAPAPGTTPLCLYQHKEWWMRPTWVRSLADVPPRTQMLLYRCDDGRWVVLLAVSGDDVRADFAAATSGPIPDVASNVVTVAAANVVPAGTVPVVPDAVNAANAVNADAGALRLVISSNKTGCITMRDVACYAAIGENPYHAVRVCAAAAARRLGVRTRRERPFPESLTGLGWCTWDSLGREVSESAIIAKMEEFRAKDVPISWVLIDDGWSDTDRERETLRGFGADRERFPHGLAHTIDLLKHRYGVRSVGVWQAFQGYWAGLDPAWDAIAHPSTPDGAMPDRGVTSDSMATPDRDAADAAAADAPLRAAATRTANGCLIPAADQDAATRFWDAWDARLAAAGVDFVKVDSQSSTAVMTHGTESYGEATWGRHRALDAVTGRRFRGALINCMGMAPENYWHRPTSPITRASDDYLPHHPESLAEHLIQNAYGALLMGELYHCDWDMFWTEHPHARVHAVLRAMSGGPVYCSDALGNTDAAVLRALTDPATGALRRPDEPARPIRASLLHDPETSDQALGVEARFGATRVVAFVGLCPDSAQDGVIAASGTPLKVREIDETGHPGETTVVDAHGELRVTVEYGRIRVFAMPLVSATPPARPDGNEKPGRLI